MKNQALFSSKDKSKKLKCCLLQFLFGALKVCKFSVYNISELIMITQSSRTCANLKAHVQ